MDDLPVFVPAVSCSTHHYPDFPGSVSIRIKGSRHVPPGALREAVTETIRQFLLRDDHGGRGDCTTISFEGVYFEPPSVLALEQYGGLQRNSRMIHVIFLGGGCHGAGFEMALCTVIKKSNCFSVVIDRGQLLNFTPTLRDAIGNSSSLRRLVIRSNMNESNMKLLALSLCQNQHIHALVLNQAFQGDASIVAFASCMHGMTSLRCLELVGNEFGTLGKQALFKVFEEAKTSVDQLLLDGTPDHVQAHIDFLLRLKQRGGRSYIGTCNRNEWIELLVEFKDDTNALYYILRADPGRISN
jgi:hypothetical protein